MASTKDKLLEESAAHKTSTRGKIAAEMSEDCARKVESNLWPSMNNLHHECGLSWNAAKSAHITASAKAGELFEAAVRSETEKTRTGKKNWKKQEVIHFFSPVDVPGAKAPVEANITVIKLKKGNTPKIYSLILQKQGAPRRKSH